MYTVDWVARVVTVPLADLTFVSGSNYTLATADVHNELRRLEWAFADGLWAPAILNHFETLVLSGIPKTRTIQMINGYTWKISASDINVSLLGIDSNLLDTYIPGNGISILANNSVGKQDVSGGLNAGQDTKLTRIHGLLDVIEGPLDHAEIMRILLSAMVGKVSGLDALAPAFRDLADSKTRISAITDADGNRITIVLDVTP